VVKIELYVTLILTFAFIIVFGIMMVCMLDEYIYVLFRTAAYTVILVVLP